MKFKKLTAVFSAAVMALTMITTASAEVNFSSGGDAIVYAQEADTYSTTAASFPLAAYPNGSYYNSTGTDCTCHSWCDWNSSCTCTKFDNATQCAAFARYIFYLAKGRYYTSSVSSHQKNIYASLTATTAQNYLQGVSQGTYLRVMTSNGYDHSIAVVSTSSTGITTYHANYGGKCKVVYATYTWSQFASLFPYLYYYVD